MEPFEDDVIARLEQIADLSLSATERRLLAASFRPLLLAANALSKKMSDPQYLSISPAFRFNHLDPEEVQT